MEACFTLRTLPYRYTVYTHTPYTHTLIHSYTHTLIHSYTHTLIHYIHSYTHTLIDPKQLGHISKNLFIAALQKADKTNHMSLDEMAKLADTYVVSNGKVNYILCFRQFLGKVV